MSFGIENLQRHIKSPQKTLLCVGPVSKNCVDATIDLANTYQIPIVIIASRRQIDSADFGGGYVNNWTTEQFCRYVREHDKGGYILLSRDHGGPWQSEIEVKEKMNLAEAMASAKKSFRADIEAGMDILHLDPGRNLPGTMPVTLSDFIERTKELILFCYSESVKQSKSLSIEIGTDEGVVGAASFDELERIVLTLLEFCKKENLSPPSFMVIQTGTKVMEARNIGTLEPLIQEHNQIPPNHDLHKLVKLCSQQGLLSKEHNADYLSEKTLSQHPHIGLDSANVAPEFGVAETRSFLYLLRGLNLQSLHDKFLELAYTSGKWKKWMLEGTSATDYDRSLIAGHYIFSTPDFLELKNAAAKKCKTAGIEIDVFLKQAIKEKIYRYLNNFGLIQRVKETTRLERIV